MKSGGMKGFKDWLKNNLMLMIITALLGVIGWGGRRLVTDIRHDQQSLEDTQKLFNDELKTYREVQMGILETISNDRTASGFWFSTITENKDKINEHDKTITNHEIRISALEGD